MKIRSGPGGFDGGGPLEGLAKAHGLGLDAIEVEFTYGVRMKKDVAQAFGKKAKELGISISIHAPYYINLASEEPQKIVASKKRILDSVERGHDMGAEFVVFHPAFYGKRTHEQTYAMVKDAIIDMMKTIRENGWTPMIATETTGKPSQFGSLAELARLSNETGCAVCVDFAHIKARQNGVIDYDEVCTTLKTIKHITGHFSGIEWTAKGERNHIPTDAKLIEELFSYLKKHDISMRVINESPQPYKDAALQMSIARRMKIV